MIGAVIGDIVGSVYEFNNIKTKDFPLFREDAFFTDDTVMTMATAEAIMDGSLDFASAYKRWGRAYPDESYGASFLLWLETGNSPYNSFGNGSAMRVAPCAWAVPITDVMGDGVDQVMALAKASAEVTHNHPEGIKGAQATAVAIYLARWYRHNGVDRIKAEIRNTITACFGYDLDRSVDDVREVYLYNETCQQTVPEAIIAFLDSVSFEDAIRNAVSLGGDSDTLAAITGSIAEAAYGVPKWILEKALGYLDENVLKVWEMILDRYKVQ